MKIMLDDDWQVREESLTCGPAEAAAVAFKTDGWLAGGSLPLDVHMPLLALGLISEPLEGDNSFASEWIEKRSWWFRRSFTVTEQELTAQKVELIFESLDSEADVWLNGSHLGHHRSAFYPFRQTVGPLLWAGLNTVMVRLTSGLEHYTAQDVNKEEDCTFNITLNGGLGTRGDVRRVMVRKPQYAYGWDWGPRVASCGIMKPAWIQVTHAAAIENIHVTTVSIGQAVAQLELEAELVVPHPFAQQEAVVQVELSYQGQSVHQASEEMCLSSGVNFFTLPVQLADPQLWWPNDIGAQPLYSATVSILVDGTPIHKRETKFGIRTVRLNTDRLRPGERNFAVVINGVPVFCKGGNWVPADSIYARVTDEKYTHLIREAREANFNMLRIWGGGLYEPDIFYQQCDEQGIMIWHDFMFSCAKYPDDVDWFRQDVELELDYQTRRLRNHPSIVLWCGNNENTWGFAEWWVKSRHPDFYGGAVIYNELAPRIVRRNSPDIPYWNCSPYGGAHPNGNEMGDRHHWNDCMMNPEIIKRITPQEYDKVTSKFVSEYGYVGPCRKTSTTKYMGGTELDRSSRNWALHTNTFEKDTVAAGIRKHYGQAADTDIDSYLLYAGLCQSMMLGYSLESMRNKDECNGALFWMYNDTWGEVGWTIIDYYLTRKISFYGVKRALAPVKWIVRQEDGRVVVKGLNDTSTPVTGQLEAGYVSFDGTIRDTRVLNFAMTPFSRSVVGDFAFGQHDDKAGVYFVRPLEAAYAGQSVNSSILRTCDYVDWTLPVPKLTVSDVRREGQELVFNVSTNAFAHAVHFQLDERLNLNDEYFDLLPGEIKEIRVSDPNASVAEADIRATSISEKAKQATESESIPITVK